ncbi:lipoate-protein ligase, mitochondrial precursor, putative [Brugia malayi]|uniref:Bm2778 n=3 Tax=Brugia TaxID=6278 RepID=A0A0K0J7E9_BRUMA|nr:lipoate-protein ligase, mitochondrial precursor, putative [Brugia malayi]CRZ21870.1 Bm2778 [Brugia malayi]VIO89320.1 lipoate-protein ligase, mitochondrial precursor, putative [Brugia malayi]
MSRNAGILKQNAKVFISRSQNIFENLAFEEWLLRNHKADGQSESMLIWSNKPAVVIGRHQNPWLEADLNCLKSNNIELARRHSGGGAVYHDLGNLNISILTSYQRHNRKRNLYVIAEALSQEFNIKVEPNDRDDLWLQPGQRKISGTAARIVRQVAYHHLTLLVNVDVAILKRSLSSPFREIMLTSATRSVQAPAVGYLAQEIPGITVEKVQDVVIESFKKQYLHTEVATISNVTDEEQFPGVLEYEDELRNWEWIYGRTPQFILPLYSDRIRVEHGIITESLENQKLVGSRLPHDVIQTYLGFTVKPIPGIDTTKYLAEMKAYLREIPKGYDPKLVALNATIIAALFGALIYPLYAYLIGDNIVTEKKQTV